jgi:hypothetical protein
MIIAPAIQCRDRVYQFNPAFEIDEIADQGEPLGLADLPRVLAAPPNELALLDPGQIAFQTPRHRLNRSDDLRGFNIDEHLVQSE